MAILVGTCFAFFSARQQKLNNQIRSRVGAMLLDVCPMEKQSMNKIFLATAFGLLIVYGLIDLSTRAAGQARAVGKDAASMQKCAEECNACQRACDMCAAHVR